MYYAEHSTRRRRAPRAAMKAKTLLILLAAFAAIAQAADTDDDPVHHAAKTVAHLHDSMLNPAAFELDAVYVTKPHEIREEKKGLWGKGHVIGTYVNFCYVYTTHNRMGGSSESRAIEDGSDNNRLSIVTDDGSGKFVGYDAGETAPCKAEEIDREITKDVAALAATLYQESK